MFKRHMNTCIMDFILIIRLFNFPSTKRSLLTQLYRLFHPLIGVVVNVTHVKDIAVVSLFVFIVNNWNINKYIYRYLSSSTQNNNISILNINLQVMFYLYPMAHVLKSFLILENLLTYV